MVQFGNHLEAFVYESWRGNYFDYDQLKQVLAAKDTLKDDTDHFQLTVNYQNTKNNGTTILPRLKKEQSDGQKEDRDQIFINILDGEIEKCVLFFLQEQGKLASKLALLREDERACAYQVYEWRRTKDQAKNDKKEKNADADANADDTSVVEIRTKIRALAESYRTSIGQDLLQLVRYVELTCTGVRKILKKHDKLYKNNPLTDRYLYKNVYKDSLLQLLLNSEGVGALFTTLKESFVQLKLLEDAITHTQQKEIQQQHNSDLARTRRNSTAPTLTMSSSLANLLEELQGPTITNKSFTDSRNLTFESLRDWNKQYSSLLVAEPILLRITAARRRLNESSKLVQMLAATAMVVGTSEHDQTDIDDDAVEDDENMELTKQHDNLSNFLNLASTLLFLTNYYIAAPSSGAYAARLGGGDALAGLVIGMTPIAALFSAFLYSWWTSYSYKNALIFAAVCAMLGNGMYALGLPLQSLTSVLFGRLLIGFGSCRSINRRYIADSYSRIDRTTASAAFVTAGSLGMALGPALAALLDILPYDEGSQYWSIENAPGWVMLGVWVIYLVALVVYFRDPPRMIVAAAIRKSNKDAFENETNETTALLKTEVVNTQPTSSQTMAIDIQKNGDDNKAPTPLWNNIPVMGTLLFCFVLKLTLECCLSSTATLTGFYFDWGASETGLYLALLGLLMFPANLTVAYFSRRFEDRDLIIGTLLLMVVGVWGIINYTRNNESYTMLQYISFNLVIFVGTNSLEGPNMSLLSKSIPTSWARGILNMGLLATEAGNFGRSVGDILITWCGVGGVESLLNRTFLSLGIVVTATFLIAYRAYPWLEMHDKDD